MEILVTIFCIGIVIFVHELGHLIAAKKACVGVPEFAVGMGPKLASFKWNDTMYSLRIFPIGGFIKVKGMDDDACAIEEDYREKSVLRRMSIIVAGSAMNIVLGFCLFYLIGLVIGQPAMTPSIDQVLDNYPAQSIGLAVGDVITTLNDQAVIDVTQDFIRPIQASNGEAFQVGYMRDGVDYVKTVTPIRSDRSQYMIGISFRVDTHQLSLLSAIPYAMNRTASTISGSLSGLKSLILGEVSLKDLAGPVGLVQLASSQLAQSIVAFIGLIAYISISLGVINMLPIPALDGGHFLLLLIEAIRKKPFDKRAESLIHNTAMIALLVFMSVIIFNDVIHWSDRVDRLNGVVK